jgi:hypothetical protein
MFYTIERPHEIANRNRTLHRLAEEKHKLIGDIYSIIEEQTIKDDADHEIDQRFDAYVEMMIDEIFADPMAAHVFESHCTDAYTTAKDHWTPESATLFAATTVIPVGWLLPV